MPARRANILVVEDEVLISNLIAEVLSDRGFDVHAVADAEVRRARNGDLLLTMAMAEHHGLVPGRLRFRAGTEAGEFRLVEWRFTAALVAPAWLARRPCGVER